MLQIVKIFTKQFVPIIGILVLLFTIDNTLLAGTKNSCVECHKNADFQVQNKKLYTYFQEWKQSIHSLEGVSCDDCHGGDPEKQDKTGAHGSKIGNMKNSSVLNYKSIPEICGQCHNKIYQGYLQSNHFKHLVIKKTELQGPNCVTCHGSINSQALDVNSVEAVCLRCHNVETGNSPENPKKARYLLNKLLSIYRFYRYVSIKDDPLSGRKFLHKIDKNISQLSSAWHTFDLKKIERKTKRILIQLKEKRKEIKKRNKIK